MTYMQIYENKIEIISLLTYCILFNDHPIKFIFYIYTVFKYMPVYLTISLLWKDMARRLISALNHTPCLALERRAECINTKFIVPI